MAKSIVVFRSSPRANGNTNSLTDAVVSELKSAGMICERNMGYQVAFMDEEKTRRAKEFAEKLAACSGKDAEENR
ncbi:MAG: hypothetical protein IKS63_03325 [Firmicutes bacterium]|nr:hypothetical protein [Bacillota bacterium]